MRYCPICGVKICSNGRDETQKETQQNSDQAHTESEEKNPDDENKESGRLNDAQRKLQELGSSRWTRALCIASTIKVVCEALSGMTSGYLVFFVSLLMCIGAWTIYKSCNKNNLNSEGFFLIHVIITIIEIAFIIGAVVMLFMGMALFQLSPLMTLLIIVIAVLVIIYWVGLSRTANDATKVARGTQNVIDCSIWPIFLQIVMAVLKAAGLVLSILIVVGVSIAWDNKITQLYNELSSVLTELFSRIGFSYDFSLGGVYSFLNLLTGTTAQRYAVIALMAGILGLAVEFTVQICAIALLCNIKWPEKEKRKSPGERRGRKIILLIVAVLALVIGFFWIRPAIKSKTTKNEEESEQSAEISITSAPESAALESSDGEKTEQQPVDESETAETVSEEGSAGTWMDVLTEQARADAENGIVTYYIVNVEKLNVREAAGESQKKIDSLRGQSVAIGTGNTAEDGKWVEVIYYKEGNGDNYAVGWICTDYCMGIQGSLEALDQWWSYTGFGAVA